MYTKSIYLLLICYLFNIAIGCTQVTIEKIDSLFTMESQRFWPVFQADSISFSKQEIEALLGQGNLFPEAQTYITDIPGGWDKAKQVFFTSCKEDNYLRLHIINPVTQQTKFWHELTLRSATLVEAFSMDLEGDFVGPLESAPCMVVIGRQGDSFLVDIVCREAGRRGGYYEGLLTTSFDGTENKSDFLEKLNK